VSASSIIRGRAQQLVERAGREAVAVSQVHPVTQHPDSLPAVSAEVIAEVVLDVEGRQPGERRQCRAHGERTHRTRARAAEPGRDGGARLGRGGREQL
jgi:hypothetical protein